jgi:hypothetical protein
MFSVRTILLLVALILFVVGAIGDSPIDWLPWGLAAFAAAFLVSDAGWDRNFGRRR